MSKNILGWINSFLVFNKNIKRRSFIMFKIWIFKSFTVDLTLLQTWTDPRLNIDPSLTDIIYVDDSWRSKLYYPDTYLMNALDVSLVKSMYAVDSFFAIGQHKKVTQQIRVQVKFKCKMDLRQFPQDVQLCNIDIRSCKH